MAEETPRCGSEQSRDRRLRRRRRDRAGSRQPPEADRRAVPDRGARPDRPRGDDPPAAARAGARERTGRLKRAKSDLQLQVLDAVITGTGWDGVPPAVQHQADTPWFRTWLLFDPAKVMKKVNQPLLARRRIARHAVSARSSRPSRDARARAQEAAAAGDAQGDRAWHQPSARTGHLG